MASISWLTIAFASSLSITVVSIPVPAAASGSPGVEETSVTEIPQGLSSGRESHVPDDLGDELRALRGSQGFGGQVVHDLHVMIDVIALVQVESARQLLDVDDVRHLGLAEAQHGERSPRRGVPAPAERHDLDGDVAQLGDLE